MKTLKFFIKLILFSIPFLGFLVVPVAVGELVPIQMVVEQQQTSDKPFVFGPQFVWRDHRFAYRVESINFLKPEVLALGSSRTTQIRSEVFDKQPRAFYNASLEGYGLAENSQILYKINEDALPDVLILSMNQNLFKIEYEFEDLHATKSVSEIPIDEMVLGTIFRTYEDLLTEEGFVENGLEKEPIFSDTIHYGARAYTFGHGYLADGSARNRALEYWSETYIANQMREDTYQLNNRSGKYFPGTAVNEEYLDMVEGVLQFSREHDIQVVGFLPPFAPEFYDEIDTHRDEFNFMFEGSQRLEELFSEYDGYYFDFTSPYYFQLGERAFRDGWHTSDYVLSQIIQMMAWTSPELFEPYLTLDLLSDAVDKTTDPNRMFFPDAENIRPAIPSALGQLIDAGLQWDTSLESVLQAYNSALFSPLDNFDKWEQTISQAIETHPDATFLYLWRAQVYLRSEQLDLLVNDVGTALKINPSIDVPVHLMSKYLLNNGEEGRKQLDEVIASNPDAGWAYVARADLQFADEAYQKASVDYLVAYQIDKSIESRDGYINSLIALDDVDGVLAFLNSAFQGTEDDLELLLRRAEIYTELALYDEAIKDYERAYILTEGITPSYIVWQGDVYVLAEQYETAIEKYQSVLEFLPAPGYVYARLGDAYRGLEEEDIALDYYHRAIELSPDLTTAYARIMDYYTDQDDYTTAIDYATQAINNGSDVAWIYGRRGRYYRELEDYDSALADFLTMSELEPDNLGHHYYIGDIYYQLNQYDDAKPWLERALTVEEPSVGGFARLADIYVEDGDYESAVVMMDRALEVYPDAEWLESRRERYVEALVELEDTDDT